MDGGGKLHQGHIDDLFGSHLHGDDNNTGWMAYAYAGYLYRTPSHGGYGPFAGIGSLPEDDPMLWILEVDVSETPSRLRVYLQSNYENPWGGHCNVPIRS